MPQTFTPENRAQLVHQLTDFLSQITVQALRLAARQWGWLLKGTAKAEIVEQMTGYLGDAQRMGAAFEKMPEEEREVLTWLRALGLASDPVKPLHAALAQGGGRQVTQKTVSQALQTLMEHGLLFYDESQGYRVPALFGEWLPPVDAPRLLHQGEPGHTPTFTLAEINRHVQHLLSAVEADRPEVLAAMQPGLPAYAAIGRGSEIVTPRPGLVAAETLNRWGYRSADELHLARFLLDQMTGGGLCRITTRGPGKQLEVVPEALTSWEEAAPAARLQRLRQWWLQSSPRPGGTPGTATTWNELDLALHQVKDYALRPVGYWSTADQWSRQVAVLRAWLLGLASALPPDTWHNVERLSNLVYHLHRDLLNWEAAPSALRWHQDKTPLDPKEMRLEIWRETYGRLIEAWLSGPATWLGYVQVGYAGGRPIAFRYRSRVPAGDLTAMPPDALRFASAEVAVLRNTWQTGELRQLLRRIAVETARDRETTTYRLDVAAFRQTLRGGLGVTELNDGFVAAGFSLPAATQARLRSWQEKAGRNQLYDNLAVIEFGDDMHTEEVKAIARWMGGGVYPASARCLIVLNPDSVPALVDELRRRGYTPQVLP